MDTLVEFFRDKTEEYASRPCIAAYYADNGRLGQAITYDQFFSVLVRKIDVFECLGIRSGQTVALLADNSVEYLVATYSAVLAGIRVLLISTKSTPEHVAHFLKTSGSACVFTSETYRGICDAVMRTSEAPSTVVYSLAPFEIGEEDLVVDHLRCLEFSRNSIAAGDDPAVILHTSGTTDLPKLVPLSHKSIVANQIAVDRSLGKHWSCADRSLCWLPLYHGFAVLSEFLKDVQAGALMIVYTTADAKAIQARDLVDAVASSKATILYSVPWMLQMIGEQIAEEESAGADCASTTEKLRELSFIVTGGSAMDEKVTRFFAERRIRVVTMFGLTEAAGWVMFGDFEGREPDAFNLVADDRLRLIETDTGEYELTLAINSSPAKSLQDHVFYTGDLFSKRGERWMYAGRKDVIYNGPHGEKVNPLHFEVELLKCQLVRRVFVNGENRMFNVAIVELHDEAQSDGLVKRRVLDYIQDHVNPRLQRHCRVYPPDVFILEASQRMPLTPKGSVDRTRAKGLLQALSKSAVVAV